ncbi:von Willebrand factor D and EGF domain-containing protein-like [Hydra vulgaris]|uniref:von Willebrand factor D and EGF domain-containing protein-like n=1 Tax=Hydra vulgaris TaxID=6087 RepID=A0ABM4BRZ7_HYDVU
MAGQIFKQRDILLVFLSYLFANVIAQDPCLTYNSLNDFQRSTAFKVAPGVNGKTDQYIIEGWYRFTSGAGGKIPTKAPPPYSCGVRYPIWLRGDEPSVVNQVKVLEGCVVTKDLECSMLNINVDVKKCLQNTQEYFVYNLKRTNFYSSEGARYCAGSEKPCGPDEVSIQKTGFTPCSSSFPKIDQDPVVTVGVQDNRVKFSCKFNAVNDVNARYEVTWFQSFANNQEKQISGPEFLKSNQNEAFLQNNNKFGQNPTFLLGYNIYCKVRSYYAATQDIISPFKKSNEFYAGFQVDPKEIDLSEKEKPKKITVTSTVPIVCIDGTNNCAVSIDLGQDGQDSKTSVCKLVFKPGPAGQKQELEVVATRDFVDDGDQHMLLKLTLPQQPDALDWNNHNKITEVQIKTIDVRTAICTSHGDPHITTFDQVYYNHYYVGEYVFVQSTARNFSVHVRTFACGSVSCNCGVAAREGDDVIVIDMCRNNVPQARFASTVEPQPGTLLSRDNNGRSFKISFPSGAYVKFDSYGGYADIQVQASSDDFQNTLGLCGVFDKDRNNDMTAKDGKIYSNQNQFTESWKLSSADSLFNFQPQKRQCLVSRVQKYCTCAENKVDCNFNGYANGPKYANEFGDTWKKLDFPGAHYCGRRKRRSIDDNVIILPDDGDSLIYEYNPEQISGTLPNFPTSSGITRNKAIDVCKNKIRNSIVGKACLDVIGSSFSTDVFEQDCVIDIQVTGVEQFGVESAINNLKSVCGELTLRNLSYWVNVGGKVVGPSTKIADSMCPNECSGNGACKSGSCICNSGFITADCSMKEGQPPVVFGIPNFGLCDIRNQDCMRTRVTGRDFIDSNLLVCKMTEAKISENPFEKTIKAFIDKGQMLSFAEISCLLPTVPVNLEYSPIQPGKPVGGYTISVSNNNRNFTNNETLFIVYDSKCMVCTTTAIKTCKLKSNSCKINGYCFNPNEANPKQWCEVCNPDLNQTSFSKRKNNIPPSFKKNTITSYVFQDEEWQYKIPAYDPENQTLVYEFIGESRGMKISDAGILTWKFRIFGKHSIMIKVTDPCGLTDTAKFEIDTMRLFVVKVKVAEIASEKRSLIDSSPRFANVHSDSHKKYLEKHKMT